MYAQETVHPPPQLIQRVHADWDHSGEVSAFSLYNRHTNESEGLANRIQISRKRIKPWIFLNPYYGGWEKIIGTSASMILPAEGEVRTEKSFFISPGGPGSPVYLFLKGAASGCCIGSLTVLTASATSPKVVFSAQQFWVEHVAPLPGGRGIQLIGKPTDSEARAARNASVYNPYIVYQILGDSRATYDLELAKSYTIDHYCEWAGPKYNEKLVAVGKEGSSATCKVLTDAQFSAYSTRHPKEFR